MLALASCSPAQLQTITRAGRKKVEHEFNLIGEVEQLGHLYAELAG